MPRVRARRGAPSRGAHESAATASACGEAARNGPGARRGSSRGSRADARELAVLVTPGARACPVLVIPGAFAQAQGYCPALGRQSKALRRSCSYLHAAGPQEDPGDVRSGIALPSSQRARAPLQRCGPMASGERHNRGALSAGACYSRHRPASSFDHHRLQSRHLHQVQSTAACTMPMR